MKKIYLFLLFAFISATSIKAQTSHIVQVSSNVFTPMNINISVGDTVVWQWMQGIHTTTSDTSSGPDVWDSPMDNTHQTFRFVISTAGVHHYHCIYHQGFGMVGTITATIPTGIKDSRNMPAKFNLEQNYPNPFNPSTVISYTLEKTGPVSLKIYNSVGQEIATLINENQLAGAHSVVFSASGNNYGTLTSGVYFYRLKTSGFEQTHKMLLLK